MDDTLRRAKGLIKLIDFFFEQLEKQARLEKLRKIEESLSTAREKSSRGEVNLAKEASFGEAREQPLETTQKLKVVSDSNPESPQKGPSLKVSRGTEELEALVKETPPEDKKFLEEVFGQSIEEGSELSSEKPSESPEDSSSGTETSSAGGFLGLLEFVFSKEQENPIEEVYHGLYVLEKLLEAFPEAAQPAMSKYLSSKFGEKVLPENLPQILSKSKEFLEQTAKELGVTLELPVRSAVQDTDLEKFLGDDLDSFL